MPQPHPIDIESSASEGEACLNPTLTSDLSLKTHETERYQASEVPRDFKERDSTEQDFFSDFEILRNFRGVDELNFVFVCCSVLLCAFVCLCALLCASICFWLLACAFVCLIPCCL